MRWLEREARGKQVLFLIAICLAAKIVYTYAVFALFHFLGVEFPPPSRGKIWLVWYTPLLLFAHVLIEEIAFRFLPLVVAMEINLSLGLILLLAAGMSAIFGILHGGVPYILVQGVYGFVYSILFLKCGGLKQRYLKPLAVTVAIHFLWNGMLVAMAYASGATSV